MKRKNFIKLASVTLGGFALSSVNSCSAQASKSGEKMSLSSKNKKYTANTEIAMMYLFLKYFRCFFFIEW